jgi:hypothetical protein
MAPRTFVESIGIIKCQQVLNKFEENKMESKKIIIGIIGAIFLISGMYYRFYGQGNISYEYVGIGTWSAGLIYYTLFYKYKEITTLLMGLIVLHVGVILLLSEKLSNPKLSGVLVFTAGVVIVLGSGFSDYLKQRKI